MDLSKCTNRELIAELIQRQSFHGVIVKLSPTLPPSKPAGENASLYISRGMSRRKAALLLRAAVRTLDVHTDVQPNHPTPPPPHAQPPASITPNMPSVSAFKLDTPFRPER